jgi:hypothetical protein
MQSTSQVILEQVPKVLLYVILLVFVCLPSHLQVYTFRCATSRSVCFLLGVLLPCELGLCLRSGPFVVPQSLHVACNLVMPGNAIRVKVLQLHQVLI